jgi:hypothetical protein
MSVDTKKPNHNRNHYIGLINESSTMETLQENISLKYDIDDSIYEQFIEQLTISKFKEFSSLCKEKEMDNIKHDLKLKKNQFIQIMKSVFQGRTEFYPLYEQIFNRFKLLKCKIIYNQKNDNYFINNIFSNEEIDIFEVSCALACFIKCFFFEKLKILFDLTDSDEDGFINGSEVKRLVYTLNYIFCREDNSLIVDSTIALLSLASIKAKKAFELVMRHPGNLSYVLEEEKYINYGHFLSAIKKIYNYKYSLMPLFISLKYSLNINRNEKEFELRKNNINDYSRISNEVVSMFKKEGDIGRSNYDFKKNLEIEKSRNNQIKTSSILINKTHSSVITNNMFGKSKKNLKAMSLSKNYRNRDNKYIINYNKICGLEVYPGKLKIKEKEINKEKEIVNSFSPGKSTRIPLITKSINIQDNKKAPIPGYMTVVEILEEINSLINKQKRIDDTGEALSRIWKETKSRNNRATNKLTEPFPPTTIDTFQPYIFDEIFQKKLH